MKHVKQAKVSQETRKCIIGAMQQGFTEDYINRAKAFGKEMRREVFRCLRVLTELDEALDVFDVDFTDEISEKRANWAYRNAKDLEGLLMPEDIKQNKEWEQAEKEREEKAAKDKAAKAA
jgi:hypothetical protein